MSKPIVKFNRQKETGNIFYILSKVRVELQKQRRINDYNELWDRVQNSKNYNEALNIIKEYVELKEENKDE